MGKTKKQTQETTIDDDLRKESEALMSLGKSIAGMGYNPYEGVTMAAYTPAQRAAFANQDAASSAFGMQGGLVEGAEMPTGATEGPFGIMGYSPEMEMRRTTPNYDELRAKVDALFRQAAGGGTGGGAGGAGGAGGTMSQGDILTSLLTPQRTQARGNAYGPPQEKFQRSRGIGK